MRLLPSIELLSIWEEGCHQPPTKRALVLLAAALPESPEQIARWSVGRHDAKLLQLRQQLFGSRLTALTQCPDCDEAVEAELDVTDLIAEAPAEAGETLQACHGGCEMRFRLPNSLDLLGLTPEMPLERACRQVLGRCLLEARRDGQAVVGETLTSGDLDAIGREMAEADPQGNTELRFECPASSHQWDEVFDVVAFLWAEVQSWAARLLRDIHELASAYGWNEAEILSLNPRRRQTYLDLIGQ
jgi:hypothetical protein